MGEGCPNHENLKRVFGHNLPETWFLYSVGRHQAKAMWRSDWANVMGRRPS